MKVRIALVLGLATLVFTLLPLHAQTGVGSTKVQIPFHFNVGERHLPAGDYVVNFVTPGVVRLQLSDGKKSALALTMAVDSTTQGWQPKLVFNSYGDRYFLAEVWVTASTQGRALFVSRAEEEFDNFDEFVKTAPEQKTILLAMRY